MAAAVQLVPLATAHAEATLRWVGDPRLASAIGLGSTPTPDGTDRFIARAMSDESMSAFAILADERHVGNVVLDLIDARTGTARLSIYLGADESRGRGIGRRAVRLALLHAFDELGLHKVWLTVHERNDQAIAAYEACGFRVEGRLREEFLLGEERVDAIRMGILPVEVAPE